MLRIHNIIVSLNNFITKVRNMNIPEILNKNINANPTENYELFSKLAQEAKSKHIYIYKENKIQ